MPLILDTGAVQHIWEAFGADGFDLFLASDVDVFIPIEVIDEMLETPVQGVQYALDFQQWLSDNSTNPKIIQLDAFKDDAIAYALQQNPLRNVTKEFGDLVIEYLKANPQVLDPDLAFQTSAISVITDDAKLIRRLETQLGSSELTKGLMSFEFLVDLRTGGHIDDAEFRAFFDTLKTYLESGQSNSAISPAALDKLSNLTSDGVLADMAELRLRPDIDIDSYSGSQILDIIGNKNLLASIGVAGDLFEVGIAIHEASAAINAGDPAQAEQIMGSLFGSILGGTAGAAAGGTIALAALALVVPEPSSSMAGATVLAGALIGAIAGSSAGDAFGGYLTTQLQTALNNGDAITGTLLISIMNDFAAQEGINLSDAVILTNEDGALEVAVGNECFPAGTQISLMDGSTKPIEQIRAGDQVVSYDKLGAIVPGTVIQLFRNRVKTILDVHGLKVTPGHRTYCSEGKYSGQHVPIIEIIISDGAIMMENGDKIRVCTNEKVGSHLDRFVILSWAEDYDAFLMGEFNQTRIRLGTKIVTPNGSVLTILDMLVHSGFLYDEDSEMVVSPSGLLEPMRFLGRPPKPEDYILQMSNINLEECYTDLVSEAQIATSGLYLSSATTRVQ